MQDKICTFYLCIKIQSKLKKKQAQIPNIYSILRMNLTLNNFHWQKEWQHLYTD